MIDLFIAHELPLAMNYRSRGRQSFSRVSSTPSFRNVASMPCPEMKKNSLILLTLVMAVALNSCKSKPSHKRMDYVTLVTQAHEYLSSQQEQNERDFSLSKYPRYDWDQDTGEIIFSENGEPKVVAKVQFVGDVSTISGTWLWAWANPTVNENLKQGVLKVKLYGEENDIRKLTESKWKADEVDGWEMTSITALLLNAKGAYKSPDEHGAMFMIFTDIQWVEGTRTQ